MSSIYNNNIKKIIISRQMKMSLMYKIFTNLNNNKIIIKIIKTIDKTINNSINI
jgi:hypothetical protein